MPIVNNRVYTDPNIGAAFSSIASMFAPPSGSDLAGYASANDSTAAAALKKQKLSQLAQFFTMAQDPNANHTVMDNTAYVMGTGTPSQGYYGVDQNNATSRANNENTVQGSVIGNLFGPLSQGQVRPDVPANVAGTVGLPQMPAVAGAPKPLSETEWQAGQQQRLLDSGKLTDQNLVDAINGKNTPVKALGPDGKPVYMNPGEATRTGADVAYPPQQGGLTVTTNPDGTTTVTQGKSLTESQSKDAYYLNNGLSALPTIDKFGDALTSLPSALVGETNIGGVNVGNFAKSADYQQAEQAGRVFINAILRKESGAAITPAEDASYGSTYLPRPGDTPENLAQKKLARERAMVGIQIGLPAATILQMEKAGIIPQQGATLNGGPSPDTGGVGGAPAVGAVEDGYRFNGGDPGDPNSWSPAGGQ